jgi:hypothetical protein
MTVVLSDMLDAAYGFTTGPLFNGVEALFSKRNVIDPKDCEFRHEKNVLY